MKPGLLVVALLPWLALTLSDGGKHSHSLFATSGLACDGARDGSAAGEHYAAPADVSLSEPSPDSCFCSACRWQLSSNTCPVAVQAQVTGQPPHALAGRLQLLPAPPVSRCFDSRAPPPA